MKKLILGLSLAAVAFSASAVTASAGVLDFEGIPFTNFPANLNGYALSNTAVFAPPGYGNLKWSQGFSVLEGTGYSTRTGWNPGNGYTNGLVSGNYLAYNGGAAPVSFSALTDDGLFNLTSAYMGAAWYDGLTVLIQGFRDGVEIYNMTTDALHYTSHLIQFDWVNLDQVQFTSLETGTVIDDVSTYNHAFVLDDLNLSAAAVPEPATMTLMLAGLGLMGIAARRRNSKQA